MQLLHETLLTARALERLPPVCRAALSAIYEEGKDISDLAADLDMAADEAERLAATCRGRLRELYDSLKAEGRPEGEAAPDWVAQREHAVVGSGRRE